jgi:flagellar assembly protein FliH
MTTVIKAKEPRPMPMRRLETLSLADHMLEAGKIIKQARREAARLVGDAHAAADRIRQQAERSGYETGQARGLAEGQQAGHEQALAESTERFRKEQAHLCQAMASACDALENGKRDLLIEAEHDLLRFALAVASKVTKRVAASDPHVAVANLKVALQRVGHKTDPVVRIHPDDGAAMRRFAAALATGLDEKVHLDLVEDETVGPGGCVLQAGATEVDATIETQLDQIVDILLGESSGQGDSDV